MNSCQIVLKVAIFALSIGLSLTAGAKDAVAKTLVFQSPAKDAGEIVVAGTSSLHDWEVVSHEIEGTVEIALGDESIETIDLKTNLPVAAQVSIRVKSLDSGKKAMDKKMFKALESDDYKKVAFVLESLEPADADSTAVVTDGAIAVVAKGKLMVTGLTRNIDFPAAISLDRKKQCLNISGKLDMRMTDFGINPPTALFGTLKTGDEISISFTWKPVLK